MKALISLLLIFNIIILAPANAASLVSNGELVGEIEKVYFGPEHNKLNDQYCMLILKHESGKKIAVLEDLYDCYWSRLADQRPAAPIHIPGSYIFEIEQELVNEIKEWAQVDEFVFAGEY